MRNVQERLARGASLTATTLRSVFSSSLLRAAAFAVAALLLAGSGAFALDYSTIKGKVINKATKEPMVGASVEVVGTDLGAITDVDGTYRIRQVPTGVYTLRVTSVGFAEVTVEDVRVVTEVTTEQNIAMEEETTQLKKVVTTADANVIDKYQTSNVTSIQRETIERAPVQTVDDMVKNVTGVTEADNGELHVRGSRAGELAYIVDGVDIRDPVGGPGPIIGGTGVTSGAVAEIQVIKDGFDPEYGNALAGVIKITSQTGSKTKTGLNLRFLTDDFGTAKLNKFSRNYDNFRMTLHGPDPFLTTKVLPALGINFLKNQGLTYFLYLEGETQDGSFNYFDYIDGPSNRRIDHTNLFGIKIPERLNNRYSMNSNIAFEPRNNIRFILSYQSSFDRFTNFDWEYRYTPGTATNNERDWRLGSIKMNHTLSKDFNYELILSYKRTEQTWGPGDPDHPGLIMQPDQFLQQDLWESYTDVNNNGQYDQPEPLINVVPDTMTLGSGSAPQYTFGEGTGYSDQQSGVFIGNPVFNSLLQTHQVRDFTFNQVGYLLNTGVIGTDDLEGETFADLNGNGVWDQGDPFRDTNGNGRYDPERRDVIATDEAETFQDGDVSLGEPFTDINGNGVYEPGVDIFILAIGPENQDLNRNSRYDGPNPFLWTPGIPFVDVNGNGVFDPPNGVYDLGEPYTDANNNGQYDGKDQFLDLGSYDSDTRWHKHTVETKGAELKINRVFSKHDLKGGFEIHQDDFDYQDIRRSYQPYNGRPDGGVFPTLGAARDFFQYKPTQGAVYFRDKLEYGSMIASLGFRWDFFVQSDGLLEIALNDDLNTDGVILGDRSKFSPRIGFSYPISDKAKVFFNYGHFYQLPAYDLLYGRNTTSAERNDVVGNYNLDYVKTIQYSFGVQYKLAENYSIKVGGYYKDEFDKVNQANVRIGAIRVRQFANSDYARNRGFELELTKRRGIVNGEISYAYQFAFGKASQTNANFLDDFAIERESLAEKPDDNDVRHQVKTVMQIVVDKKHDASLFGIPILNDWTLSLEGLFETGRPFTPGREFPDLNLPPGSGSPDRNSLRRPSRLFFDARFEKNFKLAGINYTGILWVENIFDNKFVRGVYSTTGLATTNQNIGGQVFGGSEFDNNPLNFDSGRRLRFGLQMNL